MSEKRILVLTGYDDAGAPLGDLCVGSQRAYALRNSYDFECVRSYEPGSHPSWQKLRLLRERIPNYDLILWLDCDSVVTNPFIRAENLAGPTIFTASCDWCAPVGDDTKTKFISCGNFILRNHPEVGRWLDAASSQASRFANRPCWEQDSVLDRMRSDKWFDQQVTRLHRNALNSVSPQVANASSPWTPGDFLCHLTGLGAHEHRVPHVPIYDRAHIEALAGQFVPSWWESGSCADKRHIVWLRDVLTAIKPNRTLEVGVHSGCTASAFVNAGVPDAGFCDISIRADARSVVGQRRFHRTPGKDVIGTEPRYDFVFLDGAHDLESVRSEYESLMQDGKTPSVIAAHDVSSLAVGFPYCEGPAWLQERLASDGWLISVDDKDRPEEVTKRGIMFATRDPEKHAAIERVKLMSCW